MTISLLDLLVRDSGRYLNRIKVSVQSEPYLIPEKALGQDQYPTEREKETPHKVCNIVN